MQVRAQEGKLAANAHATLRQLLREAPDTPARLRALWALHVTGGFDARVAIANLRSPDEWIRAWTLQLAFESRENLERLVREANDLGLEPDPSLNRMAETDPSPLVRLFLAAAAQRAPNKEVRAGLVRRLLARDEDRADHNLPLMVWFALEPLAADYPAESLEAALATKLPKILQFTTRRVAALGTAEARDLIVAQLATVTDTPRQLDMLNGLSAALQGQRSVPRPRGWEAIETALGASAQLELRTRVQSLALTFGSARARATLRQTLANPGAGLAARRSALEALLSARDGALPEAAMTLLKEAALRGPALRALATFNDPRTPAAILGVYGALDGGQKRDALNTLASRPAYARMLLAGIAEGRVPARDLTAEVVRQLRQHKDDLVQKQLVQVYGVTRETTADKQAEIERYRRIYQSGGSQPGDASRGRVVYDRLCAQCHVLFDSGGKVGPDITGANRGDLSYLLETIVDPNAVIPNEYQATEIETHDGRILTGIVKSRTDQAIVLQTANELVTIPREEIAELTLSSLSMMPEGLLAPLSDQEVRDLIYYLTRPGQVSRPPEGTGQ